jgi:hypothetical protein
MYYIQKHTFTLCDIICQVIYKYDTTGLSWSYTIMDFMYRAYTKEWCGFKSE